MNASASSATLTPCQTKALDMLRREGNVFLTGAAGTGKSYLLDRYLAGKPSEDFPVVASTGAAAVIVGGRTFHSFFGLGILEGGPEAAVGRALRSHKLLRRLNRACCVVIDEVSMLAGTTLKAAETVARRARGNDAPWGGLRIIAVGDFAQLPPITPDRQEKDWAFLHPIWQESDFQPSLLSTVMRTQDVPFLEILNFVREGVVNERVEAFLNQRTGKASDHTEGTRLYPHRAQAEAYNLRRLEAIAKPVHVFPTEYVGAEKYIEAAKKIIPIPDKLLLKEGALIMMRKNDVEMRWVNGSLGFIYSIEEDALRIHLLSGERIEIGKDKFSFLNGDGEEVLAAWNFPVTLAWASTIHKAQGASLDRIIVDLHALWEPGQAYVALSRVRSGSGLMVERWSASSIRAEPLVTAFYDSLADRAQKYTPRPFFAPTTSHGEERERNPHPWPKKRQRASSIAKLIHQKVSLENIASQCGIKPQRVLLYIERLLADGTKMDIRYLTEDIPGQTQINAAFEEHGNDFLRPVFDALNGTVSYDEIRLVRCVRFAEAIGRCEHSHREDVLYF
ncbi:MAG: helix-turn-helix domain-containing protein [Candidatus Peregrinibacteria bacterium]